MSILSSKCEFGATATMTARASVELQGMLRHSWVVECYDKYGKLKWREVFDNLVTTAGKNKYLDATLKTGLVSPLWYVGLVNNAGWTGYVAGDTMTSHGGWTECVAYSDITRTRYLPGTISGGSVNNSTNQAVFNINSPATIRGCFMVDDNTKGGTGGTLLGEGDFSTVRGVDSGDTINVRITCSLT